VRKKIIIILFVFISAFFIYPVSTNAVSINDVSSDIYLLEDDPSELDLLDEYNKEQTCEGSDSLLGDPNDPNSVAWLLQEILNYIKIIGPIFVVVLSSIDFAGVVVKGDDEAMTKAKKKLTTRLILAACLFFVPVFVEVLLDLFGITSNATCGLN